MIRGFVYQQIDDDGFPKRWQKRVCMVLVCKRKGVSVVDHESTTVCEWWMAKVLECVRSGRS